MRTNYILTHGITNYQSIILICRYEFGSIYNVCLEFKLYTVYCISVTTLSKVPASVLPRKLESKPKEKEATNAGHHKAFWKLRDLVTIGRSLQTSHFKCNHINESNPDMTWYSLILCYIWVLIYDMIWFDMILIWLGMFWYYDMIMIWYLIQ